MWRVTTLIVMALALAAGNGCAHHRAGSGYAYAPPLAPAVYPQPVDNTQPVAPVVTGVPVAGQPVLVPGAAMTASPAGYPVAGQPMMAGQPFAAGQPVVPGQTVPCDPSMMTMPMQTPACPPMP